MKTSKLIIIITAIILLALLSLAVPKGSSAENVKTSTSDWAMFRHDLSHTGFSDSPAPDTNELMWTYKIGEGDSEIGSSPAIVNGRVFVGCYDGRLYCFDENTGELIWKSDKTGGIIFSSPAVADGKVFVGSHDNRLYCFDETTGKKIWSYSTNGEVASSPSVANSKVFFHSADHHMYCVSVNGNLIWKTKCGSWLDGMYSGRSSPAIVDGKVYVGSYDNNVYCFDEDNGNVLWTYDTDGKIYSSPTVLHDNIFIGSRNGIYCIDKDDGDLIWYYKIDDGVGSSSAVAYGKVFVGSEDYNIYCIDGYSGNLIWKYATGNYVDSSPAVADGKIYVGSRDNKTYCLDESTGSLIWSYTTGGTIWSSPAIARGKMIIGSYDGKIYCFGSPPTKVTLQEPINVTTTSISLSWTENQDDDFTRYEIHQSTVSGFIPNETTLIKTIMSQSVTSYAVTNLSSSTIYYFKVRVVNTKELCKDSNEITIKTLNAPPTINILHPSSNETVSGTITISGNASDDVGVQLVQIKIDNNSWKDLSGKEKWEYKLNTNTLSNGKHTIYVRAYDGEYYDKKSVTVNVENGVQGKISLFWIAVLSIIVVLIIIVGVSVAFLQKRKMKSSEKMFAEKTAPVTAQCPNCGNIMKITSAKRPVKVKCPKCGAGSILR